MKRDIRTCKLTKVLVDKCVPLVCVCTSYDSIYVCLVDQSKQYITTMQVHPFAYEMNQHDMLWRWMLQIGFIHHGNMSLISGDGLLRMPYWLVFSAHKKY